MKKLNINIVWVGLFLVALSGFALAEDLSDYPDIFVDNGNLDVIIVVGDKAPAPHALAQTQIVLSLTNLIGKGVIGLAKLSSEVDEIDEVNIISIGNACDNEVSAEILGNPEPCDNSLVAGKATIEFFESGDRFHVVLNALSDGGIKRAADVLSNYQFYDFKGNIFETIVFEDETASTVGQGEKDEMGIDDEKQRIIDGLSKKIIDKEKDDEEKEPEIKPGEDNIEFEETGPEPIIKEEDNLIKKIISWFLSLFSKK